MPNLDTPLVLPCGAVIPNRIAKGAMTEGLADGWNRATPELERLYGIWSDGGAGLLLTGNVQVDRTHLERPGNVVIDGNDGLDALKRYAAAGTRAGNHLWMQINHPGRQAERRINPAPLAPSAVAMEVTGDFGHPRAMSEAEVLDVIRRFAHVATVARETGFTGVEIHSAHGYLLSQFLSPRSNQRSDDWGGSLANRARLLLEIIRATRRAVGPDFPIAVKLNSSDFQKGGFTMDEAVQVARWLSEESLDLLELSGGNYERMSMTGIDTQESTLKREAHFLDFAHGLKPVIRMPVMVTGGFRSRKAMVAALQSGDTDLVGIGGPLCVEPDLPAKLLAGTTTNAWLDQDQMGRIYSDMAVTRDQMTPTRGGCYLMTQIDNLGRHGAAQLDLTFTPAFAQFVEREDLTFEGLSGFHRAQTD
jgi:2,4-dienoyl-CoA reductase-like NADH-dependent reductase (Old Yellow Enzyme family)